MSSGIRATAVLLVIRTQQIGSLAQTVQWLSSITWINMTAHVMMHQVRLLVSRVGASVTMQAQWQPSPGEVKRGWKGGGDGHSVAMDITFDLTRWWGILTKNTPPSTFRARLPVTLAEWQFVFYSSQRISHIFKISLKIISNLIRWIYIFCNVLYIDLHTFFNSCEDG